MKHFIIGSLLGLLICCTAHVSAQGWEWAKRVGGTQQDEVERVEVDGDGNTVVVGKFSGSFMYEGNPMNSSGSRNIFVSKYASDGTLLWVQTAGGVGADDGLCVGVDKDNNVLISGFFTGQAVFDSVLVQGHASDEIFVAKYDASGNFMWVRTAGGPGNDRGKGIDSDTKGNVLVTGYYYDTCHFGTTSLVSPGFDNIFLAKYDPDGNLLWVADGGGVYSAWASSVSTDAYDNAYITGSFKETASFGNHAITSYGGNDVFLARADSLGNWTLAVNGGGVDNDYGNGIEVDHKNHIAVTGSFFQTVLFGPSATITTNGDKDGFVAYYNPQGHCLWAKNMGGPGSDKGIDVSHDKDGNVYVLGHIYGSSLFDSISLIGNGADEVFLAKYKPTGAIDYALLAGGPDIDFGKGMGVDKQGIIYVGGYFQGAAVYGSHVITSAGDRDAFVAKFYDGSPVFTQQPVSEQICSGETLHLNVQVTGPGPFNYLWFDEAGSILGAVNPGFSLLCNNPGFSGKYYCVVSNNHTSVTSDTAYIIVHPLPSINLMVPDTLFFHDTLVVSAGSGFSSYEWSTGATTESIVLYPQALGTGMKQISITVTDMNGCEAADTIYIMIIDVGIPEPGRAEDLTLYPNPATEYVTLYVGNMKWEEVRIYSLSGQKMSILRFDGQPGQEIMIPTLGLSRGMYLIQIDTSYGLITRKLMIYRE